MKKMYLGPMRPFGLPLTTRAVFSGEPQAAIPALKPVLEKHPDLGKLFVPMSEIPRAKNLLALEGSPLAALYKKIQSASDQAAKEMVNG